MYGMRVHSAQNEQSAHAQIISWLHCRATLYLLAPFHPLHNSSNNVANHTRGYQKVSFGVQTNNNGYVHRDASFHHDIVQTLSGLCLLDMHTKLKTRPCM